VIVRFDVSAVNDDQTLDNLDRLFTFLEDGRHSWCVLDEREILESLWYTSHNLRWQRRIRVLLDTAKPMLASKRSIPIIVVGKNNVVAANECLLSPATALCLISQPVRLVVEDSVSDGAFLRAVLCRFGEKRIAQKVGQQEWQGIKASWTQDAPGDGTFSR
jgi:hypothetical protein